MTLAEHLKARRLANGFTQERLAGAARLSKRTIARIEAGHPVQAETLLSICSVLRLDHAEAEAMRRAEQAEHRPEPEVLVPDSVGVSHDILPAVLAALAEEGDVTMVALPDLAAWRLAQGPGNPGTDLSRPVYASKARFWRIADGVQYPVLIAGVLGFAVLAYWAQVNLSRDAFYLFAIFGVPSVIGCFIAWVSACASYAPRRQGQDLLEKRLACTAYAFSEDSVREVLVLDDKVQVRRYDLSEKLVASKTSCANRFTYAVSTRVNAFEVHAIVHDERIDSSLLRTGPGDVLKSYARPSALAA